MLLLVSPAAAPRVALPDVGHVGLSSRLDVLALMSLVLTRVLPCFHQWSIFAGLYISSLTLGGVVAHC